MRYTKAKHLKLRLQVRRTQEKLKKKIKLSHSKQLKRKIVPEILRTQTTGLRKLGQESENEQNLKNYYKQNYIGTSLYIDR